MLMDTKISGDRNVSNQKVFTTENGCIWKVKTTGMPIIIEATGTISESFAKYMKT
jgi:hypothetical protein